MKFLKSAALVLVLTSCAVPAMADGPVNNGGFIDQAITAAIANYVSGARATVKGVAIWSNSGQRFWDPLTDGGGGGGGGVVTQPTAGNLNATVVLGAADAANLNTIALNSATAPIPYAVTSTNGATTVTTGNTFQTLLASNSARKGCLIQNPADASETLYINVKDAVGSATKARSVQLAAGAAFSCNFGGNVITDIINVTAATSAHAFVEFDQ